MVIVVEDDLEDEGIFLEDWRQGRELQILGNIKEHPKPPSTTVPGFQKLEDKYGSGFDNLNQN